MGLWDRGVQGKGWAAGTKQFNVFGIRASLRIVCVSFCSKEAEQSCYYTFLCPFFSPPQLRFDLAPFSCFYRVEDADQSEEGRLLWGGGDLANETAASDGRAPAPQRHAHLSGGGGEAAAADRHPRGAVKWFDPLLLEPWQLRGSRAVRECHGD